MDDFIREPSLFIGGEWVSAHGPELEVEDPAGQRVVGVVTQASASDVNEAISSAKQAFPIWSGTSVATELQGHPFDRRRRGHCNLPTNGGGTSE